MERGFGNRVTSDVILNLIPSSMKVESADTGRKRKRTVDYTKVHLATLNLHSERLRCCSKYFQILLDQRWSNPNKKSVMEFFLEVHTDVKFYDDCFSRMYAPNFTGIPSVDHALELLKVASQIEFGELMDVVVCYLSLVPWSNVEETKIRQFPFSTYVSFDGLSDLNERLRLHESKEYAVGQDYLTSSLETALNSIATLKSARQTSCVMFEKTLLNIVQSRSCYTLAKDTFALVNRKTEGVLLKTIEAGEDSNALETNFRMLCWLFKILLHTGGAKDLVVHMLLNNDLSSHLSLIFKGRALELFRDFKWSFKWTYTMLSIFKEVLAGRLLLNSSMRVRLFNHWEWLFQALFLNKDKDRALAADLAKTLSSFIMTLPHEHQTTLLKGWLRQVDDDDFCMPEVLELAHPMWIKGLQRSLVALESASAFEIIAKTPGQAGETRSLSASSK